MERENKKIKKIISGMILGSMILAYAVPTFAYTKEETVYSKLDSSGNSYKTIVSTHLKNKDNEKMLKDMSDLLNIENTKGDEKFSKDGKKIVWEANGEDIYYEGESQKELPIKVSLSYELNGKKIEAKDLVGKSGKVKIKINFKNEDAHTVFINGKRETLYTPFVIMCGTYIDGKNNKDVEISSGKVVDDGSKYILAGIALPGLKESLKVDDLEIPSNIEITMNTENFEMNNILIYATPKLFEESDLDIFDKLDTLCDKASQISLASEKIAEGAKELKEVTKTYVENSKEFTFALKKVSKGVTKLNSSYTQIDGAIKTLNSSTTDLKVGAQTISEGTTAVKGGIDTITAGITSAKTGLSGAKDGINSLKSGVDQIISNLSGVESLDTSETVTGLNKLNNANSNAKSLLSASNEKIKAKINTLDSEEDAALIAVLQEQVTANETAIATLKSDSENITSISNLLASLDVSTMQSLVSGLTNISKGLAKLNNDLTNSQNEKSLITGLAALEKGGKTLSEKTGELSAGAKKLSAGTEALKEGTNKLENGSSTVKAGIDTLDKSTVKLLDASEKLTEGAEKIEKGADKLSSGIDTFNKEAIGKIVDYIDGDLKDLRQRVEKLRDLSEEYKTFTLINEDGKNDGKPEFIMIIDSQKSKETEGE